MDVVRNINDDEIGLTAVVVADDNDDDDVL